MLETYLGTQCAWCEAGGFNGSIRRDNYRVRRGKSVPALGEWLGSSAWVPSTYEWVAHVGTHSGRPRSTARGWLTEVGPWDYRLEGSGGREWSLGEAQIYGQSPPFNTANLRKRVRNISCIAGLLEVRAAVFRICFVSRNAFHCSVRRVRSSESTGN